ncbi:MAG: hypothetical protein AABZ61_08735, partial [Bacteroidota bacterium]
MNPSKLSLVLVFTLIIHGLSSAQTLSKTSNFILLVVPESDTTLTASAGYRLSASTNSGNKVTINGKPWKVYSSGAFAGLLELQVGENPFT